MTVLILGIAMLLSGYTLDHPINPDWLILATPDGRYAITRLSNTCDWLAGDMNVTISETTGPVQGSLRTLRANDRECVVGMLDLVDPSPCFANANGDCDLDAGEHYWPEN